MTDKKKQIIKEIAYWVVIMVIMSIIIFFSLIYFDLANGPFICLILQLSLLSGALIARTLLRREKIYFRMIPTLSFLFLSGLLISLTQPVIARKSAAYYSNPKKTDVVNIEGVGSVQGVYSKDKQVEIYAGIPYAQAERWKEPGEITWSGIKDCSYFGPDSYQPKSNPATDTLVDIYSARSWHPDYKMHAINKMSEDSLYLNIWKPSGNYSDLPVLVFIHGGSLTTGSSSYEDYNGEEMAKKGVIMITIQYRLGVFGYYAHQELIDESEHHTTGNYGLLDQIEALKWVNQHITTFGGNPNNVTIAGESAGSSSISALCASPRAKNLFRRAIGESSSLVVKRAPHTYRKLSEALKTGNEIMKEFKCTSIAELRKIPASKLVNTKYSNSSMTLDGWALEKDPYDVYLAGESNEEALLNGYNVKEGDAFVVPEYLLSPTSKKNIKERLISKFGEEFGNKIYDVYKDKIDKNAFATMNEIFSVYWFIYPHHSWSNMALKSGKTVYRYQFSKENHFHSTYHAGEMIYAYGNVKKAKEKWKYNDSDKKLSEIMLSYWSNFAKTGNPNGEGLPIWEEYKHNGDGVMELGKHVGNIEDLYLNEYSVFEEYIDELILKESI